MTLLVSRSLSRTAGAVVALVICAAAAVPAQVSPSHQEDAAPVARGVLRLRIANSWTRWDQRWDSTGLREAGAGLSSEELGVAQLPRLAPVEAGLRTLAASPQRRLSFGRLETRSDARIVTTPITFEVGVTRRLSVGVVVPVVQTRRTIGVAVNTVRGTPANVGFVPEGSRSAAARANLDAANSLTQAASQLGAQLDRCRVTPGDPACAGITADPAAAAATLARAQQLAAAAAALGTTAATALVAPRATGVIALEIELQRNALNRQLQLLLGAGAAQASAVYFAPTDFSYSDLQGRGGTPGLLQSGIAGGLDSIRSVERVGFGDIGIGAQLMVFDRFARSPGAIAGTQSRLSVGAIVRLATSRTDSGSVIGDFGTGDGAGLELRSAYDIVRGRFGGTVAGRYVSSFARAVSSPLYGDSENGLPLPGSGTRMRKAGTVVALDVTPRVLLSETFGFDAHYGLERTGETTFPGDQTLTPAPDFCALVDCTLRGSPARTAQRLGAGLRYSTVNAHARGAARFPFEVVYTHLTTVAGTTGVDKQSREQIQVRWFYRLFGR